MNVNRFQKRLYLGILAMVLIPAFGRVVQYGQVFWSTWQMPVWTGPHQPGLFLGEGPSQLRMMILATLLTTVALTLTTGFYLIYTFRSLGRMTRCFREGNRIPEKAIRSNRRTAIRDEHLKPRTCRRNS